MILPDFLLPSRVNKCWKYSGMDSLDLCKDKTHFQEYPHCVIYQYNSRGYRDQEWPDAVEELKNAIWCVGDSFTVGLGSPVAHTWPDILQKQTKLRTINVSMDGASNNWISRKTVEILQKINPQHIVIHWSYTPRREADPTKIYNVATRATSCPVARNMEQVNNLPDKIKHATLTCLESQPTIIDEDLRIQYLPDATYDDDLINTIDCINAVNQVSTDTKVIHSFIPNFCHNPQKIQQHLAQHQIDFISEFSRLDIARDGHHYDIKTSQYFVNLIVAKLAHMHSTVL